MGLLASVLGGPWVGVVGASEPGPLAKDSTAFTIAFTGDVALNWRGTSARWREFPAERSPFRAVRDIFAQADLSVANMEGVLMRKDPKLASKRWNLWAPAVSAQVFPLGSIDLVSTANNHSFDGGDEGLLETLSHLRAAGVLSLIHI